MPLSRFPLNKSIAAKLFSVAFLLLSFSSVHLNAQTDTEFWFVVPELTVGHNCAPSSAGGVPAYLRFSSMGLPATVTVSMPANRYNPATNPNGFVDITFSMAANSTHNIELSDWIWRSGTGDVNRLENKPLNSSGINPFGLNIQSTNPITAYYEVNNGCNADIWALKGRNALGSEFYTPFPTHGPNGPSYSPRAYSAIDIVASEDNTVVTIVTRVAASYGQPLTTVAAFAPLSITLMRGETFSIFPQNQSQAVANRLVGTHITSTKPIAVTLKDDSILHSAGTCKDVVGDQLIPVDMLGREYAVVRTFLNAGSHRDHVYVLAVEDGTTVDIGGQSYTINAGEQAYRRFPNGGVNDAPNYWFVSANKPVYVMHVGGFGCEQGMAILPSIEFCTGSSQVAFTRSNNRPFFLTIMVRDGAQDGFRFDGTVRNDLINPTSFALIPGTEWRVARFLGTSGYSTGQIPEGQHLVSNTKDIFHLGILNGTELSTCYYGYFSDYNVMEVDAVVAGTGSTILKTCYGTPVQLFATGGTNFVWSPGETLTDPHSQMPFANPEENTQYTVIASGACNMTDSAKINVLVSTPINAFFSTDVVEGCAPLEITFTDESLGGYYWEFNMGDGSPLRKWDLDPLTPIVSEPPSPFVFTHTFQNDTDLPIDYEVVLLLKNQDHCSSILTRTITVYPSISASFTQNKTEGCNPLEDVQFTNTSSTNTVDSYVWDFGDQFGSVENSPIHTFHNSEPYDVTYLISLEAISPFGCRDTAYSTALVYSFFDIGFTIDKAEGCSPLDVNVTNLSVGDDRHYSWRLNGAEYQTTGDNHSLHLTNTGTAPITYTVELYLQNTQGCHKVLTRDIVVYPEVNARFTIDNPIVCNLTEVVFNNITTPHLPLTNVYSWDFGDGTGTSEFQPTHTYDNQRDYSWTYNVTLTVQNPWGCSDIHSEDVTVYSRLRADFSVLPSEGCSPLIVNIDNNSTGGIEHTLWTYGDGTPNSPTTADHDHTYINNGLFPVTRTLTLLVTNEGGCTETLQRDITIYPSVTAAFSPNLSNGCNPHPISFTDQSKANTIYWNWNFGDGGTSVEQSPSHTYSNLTGSDATYNVTLVSTSEYGCFDVATGTVTVYPYIDASFAVNEYAGCSPHAFNVEVVKHPGISRYRWDFDGDGVYDVTNTSVTQLSEFPYTLTNQTGAVINYNTTLRVENHAGCYKELTHTITVYPEVTAALSLTPGQVGCDPFDVSFISNSVLTNSSTPPDYILWDFGDGGTSTEVSPDHTFYNEDPINNVVYTTKLTASTIYGCSHEVTIPITVYPRLTAGFSFDQGTICSPFPVNFYPSSTGATQYNWDFGEAIPNETLYNGDPFTRTFSNPDPDNTTFYTITLEVENAGGACRDSYSRVLEVYPHVEAHATPATMDGCSDLEVTFGNNSTGGSLLFDWDFDDGQSLTTTNSANFSHTFVNRSPADRIFNVTLTAINPNGCTNQQVIPVTVHPKVESHFAFWFDSICTPFNVMFENNSLNGSRYEWDFGHMGQTTITNNHDSFIQVFDNPTADNILNYTITMRALDEATGCENTTTSTIEVNPRVVAAFDVSTDAGCNPLTVDFTNNSTGNATYLWDFDDGNSTNEDSPTRVFAHPSRVNYHDYDVSLLATNIHGCRSIARRNIRVFPLVESLFTFENFVGCTPLHVQLNNATTSPAYTYEWEFNNGDPTSNAEQPGTITFVNSLDPLAIITPNISLTTRYVGDPTCSSTFTDAVTVYPHIYPDFSADWAGCHPHPVDFVNLTNAYQNNATYLWDFGNGVHTSLPDPSLEYTNPTMTTNSVFTVQLTATSMHGCVDSISRDITVYPRPRSQIRVLGEYIACSPFDAEFENLSLGTNLTFTYDFNDGNPPHITSDLGNITHNFSNLSNTIASYYVTLHVESEYGCDDASGLYVYAYPEVRANFDFDPGDAACNPFTVQLQNSTLNGWKYMWDFDDGSSSGGVNPLHLFVNTTTTDRVFDVNLMAFSEYGCTHEITKPLTVYAAPVASFVVNPPLKIFPDATFAIENLTYPASPDWDYTWHFGDGYGSTEMEPGSHTYETWGPIDKDFHYEIFLSASNENCSSTFTNTITLLPPEPISLFESESYADCAPLEVFFINNSLYGHSYHWDFGDGTTSSDFEPSHVFTEPGFYNVKLVVYGDGGEKHFYQVYHVYQNPISSFVAAPIRVLLPDAWVHFYNTSQYANSFFWDVGDGTYYTERDPVHLYRDLGEYRVTLITFTEYGCSDTTSVFPAVWVEGQGRIRFPNAFVPNTAGPNGGVFDEVDYKNEVFHPVGEGVIKYKLLIFNRWGEQLFQSNNFRIGWDGYFNGKLCPQDVYVWRAIGEYADGKLFDLRGNVTLLR